MKKTYFITGSEGTGKTSIIPFLKKKLPKFNIHDFDEMGVPLNPPLKWRLDTTLHWINEAKNNQEKTSTCIIGLSFPKEILKFNESKKLEEIEFILLDIDEKEREKRLQKRNANQDVIDDLKQLSGLRKQFKELKSKTKIINTTNLSINEVANKIVEYIK